MHLRVLLLTLALVSVTWAGCFGGAKDEGAAEEPTPGVEPTAAALSWTDKRLHIDVRVPVLTLGMGSPMVQGLVEALQPFDVAHRSQDSNMLYPVEPTEPGGHVPLQGQEFAMPVVPAVRFDVEPVPPALQTRVRAQLANFTIAEPDTAGATIYDATAFEMWMAQILPEYGLAPDPNAPSIVVLHLDAFDIGAHAWRYTFPHGHLEPVRVFGERTPVLFLDPSAIADPYVQGDPATGAETKPYFQPVAADEAGLPIIADFVRDATRFRIAQGSLYPPTLAPCHAITVIYAVRDTTLAGKYPGLTDAEDLFHPDQLRRAFTNLTGAPNVIVDIKVLHLPADDPALDAISRGDFSTYEAQRAWLAANWQNYWVAHDSCEAYVSFVVHNDAASASNLGGVVGIGTYDRSKGYRISMSWVPEFFQFAEEGESPLGGSIFVQDDSKYRFQMVDFLFAHETGHILAQRHPHDLQGESIRSVTAFSSIWSAMSYQTDGRVIDFGAVDQNNFARSRAGFMLVAASNAGLEDTRVWHDAMTHISYYHWKVAADLLSEEMFGAGFVDVR